jgi:nucleotidyltransferase substrate binding protein (TIGR01987 family)
MSGDPRLDQLLADWRRALDRLDEVLARDPAGDETLGDAAIQRFEFNFELAWRSFQRKAESEGRNPVSPRDAFKSAFALGLIDDEALWLSMIADRNRTSHIYSSAMARDVLARLASYARAMRAALAKIG